MTITKMYRILFMLMFLFLQTNTILVEEELPRGMIECLKMFRNHALAQQASIEQFCWNVFDWKDMSNYTNVIGPEVFGYIEKLLSRFYGMNPLDTQPSIRKEYRRLTDREREDFHTAVQMLKEDKSVPPNKYDAIASLHSNAIAPGAHTGPNFPGWHRIFLCLFENAIKEMVPDVILPYWDSTFERNMRIPELSVMFSEHFAGNGNGYVTTGPFQGFEGMKTGRLYRNLGQSDHGPISSMNAGNILRQMRTEQITFPTAYLENSLEEAHNNVHDWVGGQMGKIDTSADDPLFFVHHCFIDYLWSLFRLKQKNNHIDPEFDYPDGADGEHHPLATMKPFQYFRNIHGYSDYWTNHVFKYEVSPYCSPVQPSCQSKWLTCDTVNWRCISAHTPFQADIEKWILNDFMINGIQNKEQWCYISVEIQYGTFSSNLQSSYFGSNVLGNAGTYQSNVFENTDCIQKDRNKIDIYVEADGISYRGRYLDFVVLEKDKQSVAANLKIAMANIDNSTTYISAYDSCGRICSPFCMVYNSNPPEYRPCSGVITNRRGPPNFCIKENANDYEHSLSFIKFYCDKSGTLKNSQDPSLNVELNHQKYHLL